MRELKPRAHRRRTPKRCSANAEVPDRPGA